MRSIYAITLSALLAAPSISYAAGVGGTGASSGASAASGSGGVSGAAGGTMTGGTTAGSAPMGGGANMGAGAAGAGVAGASSVNNSISGAAANMAGTSRVTGNNTSGSPSVGQPVSGSWDSENTYWQKNYNSRPYYNSNTQYQTYEPAYRYGLDMYTRNPGTRYEDLNQSELEHGWSQARGNSDLSWTQAQNATRDAYDRLYVNGRSSAAPAAR